MAQEPLSAFKRTSNRRSSWAGELAPPKYKPFRLPKPTNRSDPNGVLGFIENLGGDIRDTLMGIPTGIIALGKATTLDLADAAMGDLDFQRNRKFLGEIAKQYAYTYGPALKGDWDTFGQRLYDHPLAPMLDVLAVATLGAGAAARGAGLTARAIRATGKPLDEFDTVYVPSGEQVGKLRFKDSAPQITDRPQLPAIASGQKQITDGRLLPARSPQETFSGPRSVDATVDMAETYVPLQRATRTKTGKLVDRLEQFGSVQRREIKVASPVKTWKHYSANPFTRSRQKFFETIMDDVAMLAPQWFGGKSNVDLAKGATGHAADWKRHQRWLYKQHSYRHATTNAMRDLQMGAVIALGKIMRDRPDEVGKIIETHASKQMRTHAFVVHENDLLVDGKLELPEGFTFLRAQPKVSARPPGYDRPIGEWEQWLRNVPSRFTTPKWALAHKDADGNYYLVQNRSVNPWIDELIKGSKAARILYAHPTAIWKWLVLGLSPRYLVNNAVGNVFMYLMVSGGVKGIRGFVDAIAQVHGYRKAEKMMMDALKLMDDFEPVDDVVISNSRELVVKGRDLTVREAIPDEPNLRVDPDNTGAHAFRGEKIPRKAARLFNEDWQNKWYLGLHQGFGREAMNITHLRDRVGVQAGRFVKIAEQGLYPLTHMLTDVFIRRMAINNMIRETAEYKRFYRDFREAGYSKKDAHNMAGDKASENPAVRDMIQERVNDMLGDYHHLTGWEQALRTLVPFYTWDRAILRHGVRLSLDKPTRAGALVRVGAEGQEINQDLFGKHMPRFLKSIIPGQLLGLEDKNEPRRRGVLSTGLNPYSTIPGLIDVGRAMTGLGSEGVDAGESVGTQLNPFVVGFIENLTGTSLLSGRRIERGAGGIVGDITNRTFQNTPLPRVYDVLTGGRPLPKMDEQGRIQSPLLFRGDDTQQVSSLLGIPIRDVHPEKAAELWRREEGIRKERPAKKYEPFTLKSFEGSGGRRARRRRPGASYRPKNYLRG